MGKKLVLVLTLLAVVGLWTGSSAGTEKGELIPVRRGPATDVLRVSPSFSTSLVREGELVLTPLLAPSPEDTIHYDGPYNSNAIGSATGATYEAAIRLTPTELTPYIGWEIIAVLWYHHETGTHGDSVKIYDQGTASQPGPLITGQPNPQTGAGWFREDLTSPVPISGLGDLWCSIRVTFSDNEFPVGIDAGPATAGKGDFILWGGSWMELRDAGLDYNWNVRAVVDSGGAVINYDVRPLSLDNPTGMIPPGIPLQPEATVRNQGQLAATFGLICEIDSSGFPVYADTFSFVDLPGSSDSSVTFTDAWTPGPKSYNG